MLKKLLKSKNHCGHNLNVSSSKSFPYLYGKRDKRCIINLDYTIFSLKRIFNLFSRKNKKILLIVDKNELIPIKHLFKNNGKFLIYSRIQISGSLAKIKDINKIDFILLLKGDRSNSIISESNNLRIPIISFLNTNSDPNSVMYPIMTNDKNIKSIYTLLYYLKKNYV